LAFEALVFVTMRGADRDTLDAFEQAVADVPNVLQAQRLFGEPDYLLRVIVRDLTHFQKVYDERLATLPGVQRLNPTLVMRSIVENRPLPPEAGSLEECAGTHMGHRGVDLLALVVDRISLDRGRTL
jgi:DNA-binding Lrp family transcriptional regulator